MSLVQNERTKLLATALNNLSVATIVTGIIAAILSRPERRLSQLVSMKQSLARETGLEPATSGVTGQEIVFCYNETGQPPGALTGPKSQKVSALSRQTEVHH